MVYKKSEIENIVLSLVKELKGLIPVERAILFGSYAYGKPNKASDIDIAVISPKFNKMSDVKRIMLLSDCARRVKTPHIIDIDPIGFTKEELEQSDYFELGGEIQEKGVTIYQAKS